MEKRAHVVEVNCNLYAGTLTQLGYASQRPSADADGARATRFGVIEKMPARYFAIVPAAGPNVRMGEPKLLMPVAAQPMIAHTLRAWQDSRVDQVFVVVRPGDHALIAAVNGESRADNARVEVVVPPVAPPDMKASIQAALAHI